MFTRDWFAASYMRDGKLSDQLGRQVVITSDIVPLCGFALEYVDNQTAVSAVSQGDDTSLDPARVDTSTMSTISTGHVYI